MKKQEQTIFDHKMKLEVSQAQAEHLIELLDKDLKECENTLHMKVFIPLLESLEAQFNEQKI